ncbi:hypothetical protein NKI82_31685, partial [Mesorhizobium sp. M0482]|uniref:toxin TcdB middle/N-terminal domain-containing protein n=1 Tax=Mesorhizobium sp. M0482 TaxID=2956948 RepID=UPI00333A861A
MNKLLVGAALLAAGVFGADTSFVSYIRSSAGMAAFAQEAQGTSPDLGAPPSGFGNGGSALGSGDGASTTGSSSGQTPAAGAGEAAAGSAAAGDGPDAAAKVEGKPADTKTTDAKTSGTAAKTTDTEAATDEPAATTLATTATEPDDPVGAPAKAQLPSTSGSGSLDYIIGIDVSDFHGIEPSIALNYNSSRKTKTGGLYQGWLGYAWGLDGFDVIERASPGYGMPAFTTSDIYLLDGQAMVACVAGMVSPSCSTGGTHATENESYRRIALNGTTNEWKVTDRDGAVSTFRSVAAVANLNPPVGTPAYDLAQSFRWLLTSVTDTNGNNVTYAYTCPANPVCYPDTISYNGTVVKFYLETRPDLILMGNGRDMSETSQRIKAISVKVGTALRSAYKLTYDQAPFSGASRLTAVTRYGTDATIAADGTITGGTAKPLGQMSYQDATLDYVEKGALNSSGLIGVVPDQNVDGKDDLITRIDGPDQRITTVSSNNETVTEPSNKYLAGFEGHFLGNTKNSYVVTKGNAWDGSCCVLIGSIVDESLKHKIYNPCGENSELKNTVCNLFSSWNTGGNIPTVIDDNGDGIDSVIYYKQKNSLFDKRRGIADFIGRGSGRAVFTITQRLATAENENNVWSPKYWLDGVECPKRSNPAEAGCLFYDVNGDGAADLIRTTKGTGTVSIDVYLSTGSNLKPVYSATRAQSANYMLDIGDLDGDGRSDFLFGAPSVELLSLQFGSPGVSLAGVKTLTLEALPYSTLASRGLAAAGDVNGDGIVDLIKSEKSALLSAPGAGNPNLLRSVVTELGGTVAVEYAPSSTWANTYLPQVVHAVTKLSVGDGRGQTAVSSYAYAGGKYDPAARKF